MRTWTALWSVLLLTATSACSSEEPTPAVGTPAGVEPVGPAVTQSELRRAVAALEGHRNAERTYTRDPNALVAHGFISSQVLVFLPYADEDRYCIEATSSTDTELVFHARDTASAPQEGRCPER